LLGGANVIACLLQRSFAQAIDNFVEIKEQVG
jgi:hypothetical protein